MAQDRARGVDARASALSPEVILEAALRISDAENDLSGLTVRRLAAELGVGTMTLYSYFRGKEELLDSMADHVLGRLELPEPEPEEDPATALRVVSRVFLDLMRSHPSVVRLFATRVTTSPVARRGAMEAVLERLVSAGIPGPLAVRCYGFLITYAIGFASYQAPRPWGRPGGEGEELRRQQRHFYAAMPADDFPRLVELSDRLVELPSDEQYAFGVEAFIGSVLRDLSAAR
ncbi:TetR/AcrR family transcriptional regulator [Geodermatophilus sp. CPCC 206100]|uniref:TetR/AcrR family transcriptional regulator n=1 Tax=Geodermatophilus sp. CPCC 206100 TaxID=3020054 RepID=UPI003B00780C